MYVIFHLSYSWEWHKNIDKPPESVLVSHITLAKYILIDPRKYIIDVTDGFLTMHFRQYTMPVLLLLLNPKRMNLKNFSS
jgi:hypothetical protein